MSFRVHNTTIFDGTDIYQYLYDSPPSPQIINFSDSASIGEQISIIGFNLLNVTTVSIKNDFNTFPAVFSTISNSLIECIIPTVLVADSYYIQMSNLYGNTISNKAIFINVPTPQAPPPKNLTYSHQRTFLYTGQEETIELKNISQGILTVTMVAGGGCGGDSHIQSNIQFSGGGGGGGGSVISVPVNIYSENIVFKLYVGKGGKFFGENGEDSYIIVEQTEYRVSGGTASILNTRGTKGTGIQNGTDGSDGNVSTPSAPDVLGGVGGNSFLGYGGGVKQARTISKINGFGGGGKGMDIGSSTIGTGQDGIIMISYATS